MPAEILIVGADLHGREFLLAELDRALLTGSCAPDGPAAMRHLETRKGSCELVIVSARSSAPATIDLVRALKQRWPDTEVIVLASDEQRGSVVQCLAEGALALVRIPLEQVELSACVYFALERRCLRATQAHQQALQSVLGTVDPERLPEAIVQAWTRLLSADGACLMMPTLRHSGRLSVAYAWGARAQPSVALGWLEERVAVDRSPAIVRHGWTPQLDVPIRYQDGPSLVYPLVSNHRLVAVLTADRLDRPFVEADVARANGLAAHARVALDNAQIVRHLASSDRLASLGQIAASIAHEVRNPITYVIENSSWIAEQLATLQDQPGQPSVLIGELSRAAADALDGASRIREIIRDIGALANADETTQVSFDVSEAVRAAIRLTKVELRDRVKVLVRLGSDTRIVGSAGRMSQVFVNLLVNAAQAIKQDTGIEGKVVVLSRREGSRVVIEVSDNGPGISREDLPRVFEAFFTTKPGTEGTGLGLFLCRDIVRRHGGELRVRSSPGHGTTFTLELPADPAHANPFGGLPEEPQPDAAPAEPAKALPTRFPFEEPN